jgi:hypothetical protein
VAWWYVDDARKNPALREEVKGSTPWAAFLAAGAKNRASKEGSKMDLFDEALGAAPLTSTPRLAARADEDQWGFEVAADLNATPEPALPVTYSEDEDDDEPQRVAALDPTAVAARLQAALSDRSPGAGQQPRRTDAVVAQVQPRESAERKAARLLAYADAVARGETPEGPNPFAHVTATKGGEDIAAAAQAFLANPTPAGIQPAGAKVALKTYSPVERQEIIDEGSDGVTASNLDRLDISGTHYEALEATSSAPDEDFDFMAGDPNDF